MEEALTTSTYSMPNTKATKNEVMDRIKDKLENAKLNLIYTELEEEGIPFERTYTNVNDLIKDSKGKLNDLDYNKLRTIADKVSNSLETMVGDLQKGSTNAFTKVMTSTLSSPIVKSLGISLAGRAALILAPTLGTKALVGAGLAGYSLYRVLKNRKEIIAANEENELNNILMDLETTKEDDKYIDTRFDERAQELIRQFLKDNGIKFEDTGYRSLRACIYELDKDKKRSLCELLNTNLGKGIDIDERIEKAKKKLNIISSTAAGISSGAAFGTGIATSINAIDPALIAGPLNGTALAAWINSKTNNTWFTALMGGLGGIGTEVLQHIPVIGSAVTKFNAMETFAALGTIGAIGGAIVSLGCGIASIIKRIFTNKKNKKETEEFLKLDAGKYKEQDKEELAVINEKMHEPANVLESSIVDIVVGSLRDDGVEISSNPTSVSDLNEIIEKLPSKEKAKASDLLKSISYNMDNNPKFIKDLKKAGEISVGMFTAGLAAISVYDIIKGGTFLPELSQKLFPTNNIHTPVDIPPALDEKLDPVNDAGIINKNQDILEGFNSDEYRTELTGDYQTAYGANYMQNNPSFEGTMTGGAYVNAGLDNNFANNVLKWLGIGKKAAPEVFDVPKITERLNEMSPQELYDFYRTFNSMENDGSELYETIRGILGYETLTNKATSVINDATKLQEFHDIVNKVTGVVGGAVVPIGVGVETADQLQKETTSELFDIDKKEVQGIRR